MKIDPKHRNFMKAFRISETISPGELQPGDIVALYWYDIGLSLDPRKRVIAVNIAQVIDGKECRVLFGCTHRGGGWWVAEEFYLHEITFTNYVNICQPPGLTWQKSDIMAAHAQGVAKYVENVKAYLPNSMPDELKALIRSWNVAAKSPYSYSYYDYLGKTWEYTKPGGLRVSDHWNFESRGRVHCITDVPVPEGAWAVGVYVYNYNIYRIINIYNNNAIRAVLPAACNN